MKKQSFDFTENSGLSNEQLKEKLGISGNLNSILRDVPLSSLDVSGSKMFQKRQDEDIADLIQSINEYGIIQPILCTSHPTKSNQYRIFEGFRRIKCISILSNPKTAQKYVNEVKHKFNSIRILIYTLDGQPLSDLLCKKIALLTNTQRRNWDGVDIIHYFIDRTQTLVWDELEAELIGNPAIKDIVKEIIDLKFPRVIFDELISQKLLKKEQVLKIKDQLFAEASDHSNFQRKTLEKLAYLVEIPNKFYPVLTGRKNKYGLYFEPDKAMNFFLDKNKKPLPEDKIERKLIILAAKLNPLKKGVATVQPQDIKEKKVRRVFGKKEKTNSIMGFEVYIQEKGDKQISLNNLVNILKNWESCKNQAEFKTLVEKETGITMPTIQEVKTND